MFGGACGGTQVRMDDVIEVVVGSFVPLCLRFCGR